MSAKLLLRTFKISPSAVAIACMAFLLICQFGMQPHALAADDAATGEASAVTSGFAGSALQVDHNEPTNTQSRLLDGKAEIVAIKDATAVGMQGSQLYRQGVALLNSKNYEQAGEFFRLAAKRYEKAGLEGGQAQALYAAGQANMLSGRAAEAAKLYQAAIDLFQEYDPLSPYLKAALDNLKKVAPTLSGRVKRDEARLQALTNPKCIMTVDRNTVLKLGISQDGGTALLSEKATADVHQAFVNKTVLKAFVRMTCLETAELGSNSLTAANRWYSLLAHGKPVAVPASSISIAPVISVKINEHFYNIPVELPDIGSGRRTVFLLTDGMHIVAIDPRTEDTWNLISNFSKPPPEFTWKKLTHEKAATK